MENYRKLYQMLIICLLMMSQWKIQSIYAQGCTTIPIPSGLVWLNTSSGVTYTTNYILADFDGNIVAISPSSTEFIPTPATAFASGSYNIFGIQYDIANPPSPVPTIGGNLATIGSVSGCFELSEGIVYNCNTIDCFDPTQSFTYSISNADLSIGRSLTLFLADNSGNIIAQSGSPADFTTEVQQAYALGINSFYVYYLNSLNSEIPPATILAASNVNDLFLLPSSCRNADFEEDYIYFEFAPSITPITDISYAGPYCTTDSDPMPTAVAGFTTGGTYSAASGLVINPTTGVIDLSASSPGTYTVTYSIAASGCNPAGSSTAQLTITPVISPVTGINYNGPYCTNDVDPSPTMAAGYTLGGSYTSTAGLVINSSTGVIDLSASSPGTYDITYTVNANGCNPQGSSTTSVTINVSGTPITDISYAGPYCTTDSDPMPTAVAGFTTGGTYSAASGLVITPNTGVIDLSASSPGTYTVTYTIAASGCNPAGSSTAQLTITPAISPVTGINYYGPYCTNDVDPSPIMAAGYTLGGSYTSTAGLVINSSTGVIDLSASSPGTYDITYTVVANGCNPQGSSTTSVTINVSGTPITDISFAGPYCTTDSDPIPTAVAGFTTGGTYSAASGLIINPTTGVIDLSASSPGTYTVTYTIAASGCNPAGSSTAEITIENCCVAPIANAGSDQIVCAGELVQLGNFPVLLQGSDVTYLWTPNIDLNCNDCPNPISTTNIDRVYTLTVTNACGSYTDQVAIDVVSGTPFELGPAVELCSSEFPYTIQGPDGYATYIWSVGYAQLAQSQNFVVNGPANYQLIAYDVNGCVFSDVIIIELADDCTSPILTAIKTSDYEDANNDGALNPGEQINYSISITNMANATATALNVSLFDPLPSDLSYIDGSISAVSTGNGPAIADFSAGNINALLGNLAPGQSATVSFSALVNVPYTGDGTIENQGIFSADNHPDLPTNDPNTPVPVDPTTDPVYSSPILTALKTSNFYDSNDDGLLNPGEQIIYSITVTNAANATGTAMNVMMTDVLQSDVQYLVGSLVVSSQGNGTTSANYFPTTILASLGNLAPGQSAVISFVVIVDEPYTGDGTIENQAIFSADNHSDISTDNPATPQSNDPTINTISNPSGCQTFFVSHEINCLDDNLEYNVVLTIVGEPGQEFLVTSSHTGGYNGTTSSSIIDGPFSTDMGYSYTVTPVDDIDCSITVGEEYIECIVTPITLVSFNGVVEENRNLLKWTTGSEENNDYFILNRSLDGSLFESIAVIESTNGNGELINYSYADTDVKAGVYYYSLTQVDFDGTTSNSYIVTLVRNNHIVNNISLSPVPAHDLLQVSWTSEINGSQEIRVLDLTGRQVMTKEVAAVIGSNNIGLDISYLPNGAYFVEMTMKGQTNLVKMIKQ